MHFDPVPAHDLLIATSCRSDPATAVVRALRTPLDWTYLTEQCLQHRVAPALLGALAVAPAELVPVEFLDALKTYCQEQRSKSRELLDELFMILDELDRHSVPTVPFKGPLLGELVFGDFGLRSPGDIDLLVHSEHVGKVCEVLANRGYIDGGARPGAAPLTSDQRRLYERFQCEYQFVRLKDEMVVEPHWELSQRPLAIDVDYVGMLARARPTRLCGREVTVLAPEDLLLALCVHGAKHHWQRLAWLRDVAGVLTKWPSLDLGACLTRAEDLGCGRLLMLSLAVVSACSGQELPGSARETIERDSQVEDLEQRVFRTLFSVDLPEPRNDRIDSFRMRLRERPADRFRYAARTWLTPRRHHLELVALPSKLVWGYYPLKIGLDIAIAIVNAVRGRQMAEEGDEVA